MTVEPELTDEEIEEYEESLVDPDDPDVITLPDSPELVGFDLAFEEPPEKRAKAPSKVVLAWEEFLGFLKDTPGKTIRVFVFNLDNSEEPERSARSRARSIRARLVKTQPTDDYTILVEKFREDESWRVYARYNGTASAETIADRERIVRERHERGIKVAAQRHGTSPSA